jgi:hypothetical protein
MIMETCLRRVGKWNDSAGFVLVEVLPALGILLLALIGSMRLAWTAMEHNRAVAAAHWREQVLPLVWRQWESGNSGVAVVRETGDGLEVRFFPNPAWLPDDLSEADPGQSLILRREPAELGAGRHGASAAACLPPPARPAGKPFWSSCRRPLRKGSGTHEADGFRHGPA